MRNSKYGMSIKGAFQINNAVSRKCKFVAHFYTSDGAPLKDFNQQYYTPDDNVAVGEDITPKYSVTLCETEIYIPYEELHLAVGNHNLKVLVSVFDDQGRIIAQGGAAYFTYRNGPVISPIFNIQSFDNLNYNLVVMPKFTIQNARYNQL